MSTKICVFMLFLAAVVIGAAGNAAADVQVEYFSFTDNFATSGSVLYLPDNPVTAPLRAYIDASVSPSRVMQPLQHYTDDDIYRNFDTENPPSGIGITQTTGTDFDRFAARYRANLNIQTAGDYTFYGRSDDGIRVWLNATESSPNPVINQWILRGTPTEPGAGDTYGPIYLAAGDYPLTVEYYENGVGSQVYFEWIGPGISSRTAVPSSRLSMPKTGVIGSYRSNSTDPLSGSPTFTRYDAKIDYNWLSLNPDNRIANNGEYFTVRWQGMVQAQGQGNHIFNIWSDDGVVVAINGTKLIDNINGGVTNPPLNLPSMYLNNGEWYSVDVRLREITGDAYCRLSWATPTNGTVRVVPEERLRPVINAAPTNITLSATSVNENVAIGTTVGTLTSTDPDNPSNAPAHQYSEMGGTGAGLFAISGTSVITQAGIDYESGASYTYTVRSTDVSSIDPSPYWDKTFTITINNMNDAPTDIVPSDTNVDENAGANAVVCTLATVDPDNPGAGQTHSYVITGGTDASLFNINGNELRLTNSVDYETKSSLQVQVRTTDAGAPQTPASLTYTETLTIAVNNLNEAPTDIAPSDTNVDENAGANAIVCTLSTTDPDNPSAGQTHSYAITGGADAALFNINGNELRLTNSVNYEAKSSLQVQVQTTDAGAPQTPASLTYAETLTIAVNNLNEAPTDIVPSDTDVNENAGANAVVCTLATTDPDNPGAGQTHSYAITGGADAALFNINGNELRLTSSANYEAASSLVVQVRTTDAGAPQTPASLTYTETLTIAVNNLNEAPTDLALSNNQIDENAGDGATIGTLSTTDPDNPGAGQTFVYSIDPGLNGSLFQISGNLLQLKNSVSYETYPYLEVTVRSTDQGAPQTPANLYKTKTFYITVNNLNDTPTDIQLSSASIQENQPANTQVGTLTAVDQDTDQNHSFALVAGVGADDNGSFVITSGNQLRTTASFVAWQQSVYHIRLQTTDNGTPPASFEKQFTINVLDVTRPSVTVEQTSAIDPTNQIDNGARKVTFRILFSEPVTGLQPAEVQFTGTATQIQSALVQDPLSTGNNALFELTVTGVNGHDGTIIPIVPANVAQDIVGGNGNYASTSSDNVVVYDVTPPAVTVTAQNTNSITPTITGTVSDNHQVASVTVVVDSHTYAAALPGDGTWSITIPPANALIGSPPHTYPVNATALDAAGNSAVDTTTNELHVDTTEPTIVEVVSLVNTTPTNAPQVQFLIRFSLGSGPVVANDLALDITGNITGAAITGTSQSALNPKEWTVTVSTGSGDGTLSLDVVDANHTILDAYGDPVVVPFTAGQTYTIDKSGPEVTVDMLIINDATPILTGSISDISDVDTLEITVDGQSCPVDISGEAWSAQVPAPLAEGRFDVVAHATDSLGNPGSDTTFDELTIDLTPPEISVAGPEPAETSGSPVAYAVTYTGVDVVTLSAEDITLLTTDDITADVAVSGGKSTMERTITLSHIRGEGSLNLRIEAGTARDEAGNFADEYLVPGTLTVSIPPMPLPAVWLVALLPAAGWLALRRRKK